MADVALQVDSRRYGRPTECLMKHNHNPIIAAVLAASFTLAMVGPAFAQRDANRHGEDGYQQQQGRGDPHQGGQRGNPHQNGQRGDPHQGERGAGPDHGYYRGDRLPPEYRNRSYVVDDWRGHHLSAPPRGYHWVQTGSDYVLVAIATGVILKLLLNN
jgi:Ni/Co efflux regulator RcnB